MEWIVEILWATLRILKEPLLFYSILVAIILGFWRVKKERESFHVHLQDSFFEIREAWKYGWIAGIVLSIVVIGVGFVLPSQFFTLVTIATLVLSLTLQVRLLSPAYTISLVVFASFLPFINDKFPIDNRSLCAAVIVMSLLLFAEARLIVRSGGENTSPRLVKGNRGLMVGIHIAKKLWVVPMFMLLPGEQLVSFASWWPYVTMGGNTYALILFPFFIGFSERIQSDLPRATVKETGRKLFLLAFVILLLAIGGIFYFPLVLIASAVAIFGREYITFKKHASNTDYSFFTQRSQGLVILGIIPKSPAEEMLLEVGELIVKVNGVVINNQKEFYALVQENGSFCKLEVVNVNGENRFAQTALYSGQHHELGVVFAHEERKWE